MITGSRSLIYHYWPLCVLWATYDYRKQVIDLPLLTPLCTLGYIWLQEAGHWSTTTNLSVYFGLHMITESRSLIYHYWPLCVLWAPYDYRKVIDLPLLTPLCTLGSIWLQEAGHWSTTTDLSVYFGLHMITGSRSLIYHYWPLWVLWAPYDYRKQVIDLPLLTPLCTLGYIWLQEAGHWFTTTDLSEYFGLHMITGSRSLIYHYWPLCVLWAPYNYRKQVIDLPLLTPLCTLGSIWLQEAGHWSTTTHLSGLLQMPKPACGTAAQSHRHLEQYNKCAIIKLIWGGGFCFVFFKCGPNCYNCYFFMLRYLSAL